MEQAVEKVEKQLPSEEQEVNKEERWWSFQNIHPNPQKNWGEDLKMLGTLISNKKANAHQELLRDF